MALKIDDVKMCQLKKPEELYKGSSINDVAHFRTIFDPHCRAFITKNCRHKILACPPSSKTLTLVTNSVMMNTIIDYFWFQMCDVVYELTRIQGTLGYNEKNDEFP